VLRLLADIREAMPDEYPVFAAGGVVDAADAAARIDAGAGAVVCGTLFLMSEESGAHPAYKARLLEARETLVTQLFGVGWPARHRVVANAATARWLRDGRHDRTWLRALQSATAPVLSRAPTGLQARLAAAQKPTRPLFGPAAATVGGPANLIDAGPLYAGSCIERISEIRPAAELVRELAGAVGR